MIVMKFGGSSLASAERVAHCATLVRRLRSREPVVVVSALGPTTNQLIASARAAAQGNPDIESVQRFHADLVRALGLPELIVSPLLGELWTLLRGVALLRELTPRTLDLIMSFGERLSCRVFAAVLTARGIPATGVDAFDIGLATDARHGHATPKPGIGEWIAAGLRSIDGVPVVTGFLGRADDGSITTLGRSGSDYSASIVGAAIGAEEVQIWTDVAGVMTCDPSLDERARSLPVLSFEEAAELAYYGAKVLHPSTLVPAIECDIPVRVLNTLSPSDFGTLIVAEPRREGRLAKSVAYKEDVCLIHLASRRLMSAGGLLTAALGALAARGIGVRVVTTSESTVSIVTESGCDADDLARVSAELERVADVSIERNKAIICVVGEELRGRVGVLGRLFSAVAERGIKARMVTQSGSEINVGFLVDESETAAAVRAVHRLLVEEDADQPGAHSRTSLAS